MVAKSHRNWSTISLGSLVIAGAAIALAALFQSPHLAFADDLSENAASAMQADAYAPVAAPAPPATSATPVPAPVIPAEGVAGAGTAAGATPAVPPASSIAIGGYYFGSWGR